MLRFKFTLRAHALKWVDPADVFATHAFGGLVATLLCGAFAQRSIAAYDGETAIAGGALHDGNWRQLAVQLAEGVLGAAWSFGVSYACIAAIDCVPGMEVLCTDE